MPMKSLKLGFVFLFGLLLGWACGSFQISHVKAEADGQLTALRVSLDQSQQAKTKALVQADQLRDEADVLRQRAEEVHRLRGEVSLLRRELGESQAAQAETARIAKKVAGIEKSLPDKRKPQNSAIAFETAPPIIQAALLREMGALPARGNLGAFNDENGKAIYAFKGQLADGRSIALSMADDGSVLQRSAEISMDKVPSHIATTAAQAFGSLTISGAREVVDGVDVRYELTGKSTEAGMQVTVGGDGKILSYSGKFQQKDKESLARKTQK